MHIQIFRSRLAAVALTVSATVGLAGAGAAATQAANVAVTIKNFDFQPMAVTIPAGGSVTWKNLDAEPHTVTSADGSFRSAALDEDQSFSFKFTKPGVYKYLCTIHPKMVATVTVK